MNCNKTKKSIPKGAMQYYAETVNGQRVSFISKAKTEKGVFRLLNKKLGSNYTIKDLTTLSVIA